MTVYRVLLVVFFAAVGAGSALAAPAPLARPARGPVIDDRPLVAELVALGYDPNALKWDGVANVWEMPRWTVIPTWGGEEAVSSIARVPADDWRAALRAFRDRAIGRYPERSK